MFLQKIKQQFLDHAVLLLILTAASVGSFKNSQIKIQLTDLVELQLKVSQLENTCTELMRVQEELDALRLDFGRYLARHSAKSGNKNK